MSYRLLALAAAALMAGAAAKADPPPPGKAGAQVDELTVTGRRKDPDTVIRDYITTYTARSPIGRVSRWDEPVCPGVIGLSERAAFAVVDRVRQVAKDAGAPVSEKQPCYPNILIVFTREPQDLMKYVGRKNPEILGYHYYGQRKALTTVTHPIQTYYATATRDHDRVVHIDSTESDPEEMSVKPSRLQDGLDSIFAQVTVVVDTRKTTGMEIRALADYVAILSLSQAKPADSCSPLPSIRNLFLPDCDPSRRPTSLSATDADYLHALYELSDGLVGPAQRSAMQLQMQGTPPR